LKGERRFVLGALLLLAAGWVATLWISPWSDERVNDLFVYRVFTEPVLDGGLPYRDVFLEYPPLAAPAIGLPGLLGTGEEVFRWAFAGWTFLLAAAVVILCGALAGRTGGDARRGAARWCAPISTSRRWRCCSARSSCWRPPARGPGWPCWASPR
jgi:hypothetical protein